MEFKELFIGPPALHTDLKNPLPYIPVHDRPRRDIGPETGMIEESFTLFTGMDTTLSPHVCIALAPVHI